MITNYRILLILVLASCALAQGYTEEPEPLGEPFTALELLSSEPSAIVHQCVNVITGDYIDIAKDIQLPGAEPLSLARFYCSSDTNLDGPFKAWKFNHDQAVYENFMYYLRDSFGAVVPFYKLGGDGKVYVTDQVFKKRVTNTAREMSGKTHLRNKALLPSRK